MTLLGMSIVNNPLYNRQYFSKTKQDDHPCEKGRTSMLALNKNGVTKLIATIKLNKLYNNHRPLI